MKFLLPALLFFNIILHAQNTVGVTYYDSTTTDGYVLIAPMLSNNTYLIDKCGKQVHLWESQYHPAFSAYFLENGILLRTGDYNNPVFHTGGGIIEKIDWQNNVVWNYVISDSINCQHHDIRMLPNGNILAIVSDLKLPSEAIAAGRDTNKIGTSLWSEKIVEIQPVGTDSGIIVWEWSTWDHLIQEFDNTKPNYGVVADHSELVNLNYTNSNPKQIDWLHFNAVDYNPDLDQIMISVHNFSEIWVIDHSTTTAQAASHTGGNKGKGGDLLFRWGNPRVYQHGSTLQQVFYGQHNAHWVVDGTPNAGKILVYNNGLNRPAGAYSTLEMIDVDPSYPVNGAGKFLPDTVFWRYTAPNPTDFFSQNISGVQELANGGYMVCQGASGKFFELSPNDSINWRYTNPVTNVGPVNQGENPVGNAVFRSPFYPPNYAGFAGITLTPTVEIEGNPIDTPLCTSVILPHDTTDTTGTGFYNTTADITAKLFPNPAGDKVTLQLSGQADKVNSYTLINILGQAILQKRITYTQSVIDLDGLPAGMYFIKLQGNTFQKTLRLVKQ